MTFVAPPGSPCIDEPSLYDGETYEAIKEAIDGCRTCPSLPDCRTWAHGRDDLQGVVAGIPRGDSIGKWDRGRPIRRGNYSHCQRGHAMTDDNTYHSPSGKRCCKECRRAKQRERDQLRRASV